MVSRKSPNRSPDRRRLTSKVIGGLVSQIEMQQQQILTLANNLNLQFEQRLVQINLYKERISQMTTVSRLLHMERNVDAAKTDMLLGMTKKEALQHKLKLEQLEGELADFKEGFKILSHKDIPNSVNHNGEESEVQKLKHENGKLVSKISFLSSERDFAWNQFKEAERNWSDQIKSKSAEIKQANERISKLMGDMEKLQSSNYEKDENIMALKTKMTILEEEISRLNKETELLKRSKSEYNTPVLRHCSVEKRMTRFESKNSDSVTVRKEIQSSQALEKGSRTSKRKAIENNNPPSSSEVPKLFTSSFKVPKLKHNSSPCAI